MILRRAFELLILAGALAACGQKGPLFLPDTPAETLPAEDIADEDVSESG